MNRESDWPEAKVTELPRLVATGMPYLQIAAILGVSNSAAIGKARRSGAPSRPSPIKRNPDAPVRPYARRAHSRVAIPDGEVAAMTLPPLASADPALPAPGPIEARALPIVPARGCQWIASMKPLGAVTVFCGVPTHKRRPYCVAHCKNAFVNFDPSAG